MLYRELEAQKAGFLDTQGVQGDDIREPQILVLSVYLARGEVVTVAIH